MIACALLLLLLGLLLAALLQLVAKDGYGHRPPPASHHANPFDPRFRQ